MFFLPKPQPVYNAAMPFLRPNPGRQWVPPWVRLCASTYFTLVATQIVVNDYVIERTDISGSSMIPTLSPDHNTTGARDGVLWWKWNATAGLARGDVVLLACPHRPEATAVKRIVALPGDTVLLDPRRCPPPGDPAEPAWRAWPAGRVRVPPGHVWVEGDNWRATMDSNYYGPLSKSLILGKALCIYKPWARFGTMPWESFHAETEVLPSQSMRTAHWTADGLPVDLAEVGAGMTLPPALRESTTAEEREHASYSSNRGKCK